MKLLKWNSEQHHGDEGVGPGKQVTPIPGRKWEAAHGMSLKINTHNLSYSEIPLLGIYPPEILTRLHSDGPKSVVTTAQFTAASVPALPKGAPARAGKNQRCNYL